MRPEEKGGQTHCKGYSESDPQALWGRKQSIRLVGVQVWEDHVCLLWCRFLYGKSQIKRNSEGKLERKGYHESRTQLTLGV